LGDIAQANAGIVRDTEQDLSVVREELVSGHLSLGHKSERSIWLYITRYE
jgi:hypothetical protein